MPALLCRDDIRINQESQERVRRQLSLAMEEFVEDLDDGLDDGDSPDDASSGEMPVEDLNELDADDEPPEIEGIEDDEVAVEVEAAADSSLAASTDAAEGSADGSTHGPDGVSAALLSSAESVPKELKFWPLKPSLTPKKRGRDGGRVEMVLDIDVRPSADGVWRCTECPAAYETRTGLFAHTRFCVGRAAEWRCEWCSCSELETSHKATGPSGIKTLCSACGQRYRHGAHGMPEQNDKGEWMCTGCGRGFPSMGALGGHRRFCDGGVWRCQWCDCKYEDANGKGPGPSGAQTLCSACANRWRSGHTGPPQRNEDGKFMCEGCSKTFDTIMGLGR